MLRCSGCQHDKPENEFYREKYRVRGYSIWCKMCALKRERKRRGKDVNAPLPGTSKFDRKKHREINKDYYTMKSCERRAKKQAIYANLSKERKAEVREIYRQARLQNKVVDHIHPLNHPSICGLHVPWNMQLLTFEENAQKSNKFPYC